jgi:hypothetical protein
MRALVLAPSSKPRDPATEVALGRQYRYDYVELATRHGFTYLDRDSLADAHGVRALEERARIDLLLALHAMIELRRHSYDVVLSLSERVGIPLALLLGPAVPHVMISHHLLSRPKMPLIRLPRLQNGWRLVTVPTRAEQTAVRQRLFATAPDRVRHLANAADTDFFASAGRCTDRPADHFASLGVTERDYPTLLEALRRVPEAVGEISMRSPWDMGGRRHELSGTPVNARFPPYVPVAELPGLYAGSRFVVVPLRRRGAHW